MNGVRPIRMENIRPGRRRGGIIEEVGIRTIPLPDNSPPIILTTLATDEGALYRKSVFGRFLSQTILLPLF